MADYYSILAGAVRGHSPNTPAARRRLYDRARSALLLEMRKADPPIARSEIMVAQIALNTAIGQVEADACLVVLEKFLKAEGERPTVPDTAVEHIEEYRRPHQGV